MVDLFNGLLELIAKALVWLHSLVGGGDSGWSWALAIVLLTLAVRLLLFPLFIKQTKTQRAMAELQPKIKELQAKHKGDRETLNQELMKLYKEHGANPLAGCLPVLLQAPIFIAMYQVLRQLGPSVRDGVAVFPEALGVSRDTAASLGQAKIFGAPIASGFTSSGELLRALQASPTTVKVVAIVLILAMAGTTFLTSRQMMSKNAPADSQQATQQKILLYVMPVMLAAFGIGVAIGTLIYWTTTNVVSMAQQTWVIRRLGHPGAAAAAAAANAPAAPEPAIGGKRPSAAKQPAATKVATTEKAAAGGTAPAQRRPNPGRQQPKRGKGQRRGGRR